MIASSMTVAALGDVAEFVRGINFKPDDVVQTGTPGTVACLRTKNVQAELDLSDVWAVRRHFVNRPEQIVQNGDILVSSANSWNLVGKCCWIPELPWETTFGGFVSLLRPNPQLVEPRFLYRWFASDRIQGLLRSFGNQTTSISNLNIGRCRQLQVPLPPLPEQRRIAAILDKADGLRAKRRAALAHLNGLTQAVFLEMFGNPVENERAWRTIGISECVKHEKHSLKRGPFGGALKKDIFVADGYKVYEQSNVISDDFQRGSYYLRKRDYERLGAFAVKPGDLLVSCSGTIGKIAVVPEDATPGVMNQALLKMSLNPDVMLNDFFTALWNTEAFATRVLGMSHGTGMKNMKSMDELRAIPFIVPPMSEQREFARRMGDVGYATRRSELHLDRLEELFASVQHQAFAGEL